LNAADVGDPDDSSAEGVTEIAGGGRLVWRAARYRLERARAVEVAAGDAGEHDVVLIGEELALAEAASDSATCGAIGTERTLPDFGEVRWPFV
jgi:hypothetical protein